MPLPTTPPAGLASLSQNARTVLEKRYLVKDQTGAPTEQPEEMFWRVATTVADADRRYGASDGAVQTVSEDFYRLMTERRFEPNSPTLMNAGRPLGQLSACFGAGTMVSTQAGPLPIERITVGTPVVTHLGHYRRVTQTMRREGALFRVKIDKLPELIVTAEHPMLTDRGWVAAGDLRPEADYVKIGVVRDTDIDAPVVDLDGELRDDWMYQANRDERGRSGQFSSQVTPVRAGVVVDRDVAWLLGFYVAEGSISKGYDVRFVMSMDEEAYGQRVQRTLNERFGLESVAFTTQRQTSWRTVRVHSKLFARWLDREFGHGFAGKRVPDWMMHAPEDVQEAFLRGVAEGDGTPVNAYQTRIVMSNEGLVRQLFDVAVRLGYWPTLTKCSWPAGASTQPWGMTFGPTHNSGMVRDGCYRVRAVEALDQVADVYNLEVEEDHTYVANHVVVHNCFVLPVADALTNGKDGIYDTLKAMAIIHQSGGGTGFGFSRIRPKGSMVRSTTGVASGPVSFMQLYDASTDAVKQGGTRRGANMGILRVDHPNILEFITCKEDITKITNFNISVAVTDVFMAAVKAGTTYELKDPRNGAVVGELDANMVWEKMIEGAWRTGEPGCFFVDEANRYNPVPHLGSYEATNPCGEQPLLPYDVCNLGSINVGYYVKDGQMDWAAFRRDIHLSTHFLDNIIDVNRYPLVEIDTLSKRIRRIGLGVMGFADALVRLGIAYDSPEGVEFGRKVMAFVDTEGKRESERLAHERGAFPEWARSIWGPDETCARDASGKRIRPMQLLRNCNITTVAPTGTISIIAGCSSGLEPLFAVAFMRNQAGVMMPDVNEDFVDIAKREGWYSDALMERIATEGRIDFPEVPAKWQRVFVTANAIKPEWHMRMQAAFQEHCDSGISKTTNFAHTATVADVRAIYELAYQLQCKGVTVYRDGSRDNQVLSTGATDKAKTEREKTGTAPAVAAASDKREIGELLGTLAERDAEIERLRKVVFEVEAENTQRRAKRSRPDKLRGTTSRYETPLGTMFANITEDDRGQPFEVFINLGKAGGSAMADAEAMGRLISLALRSGIPMMEIHRQLRGIASDRVVGLGPKKILSVPDAIGMALEDWWRDHTQGVQQDLLSESGPAAPVSREAASPVPVVAPAPRNAGETQPARENYSPSAESFIGTCPDCGSQLEFAEGCAKCHVCGFSECG
jgi:ribonucleoside-diphosphate reductase alpha chain